MHNSNKCPMLVDMLCKLVAMSPSGYQPLLKPHYRGSTARDVFK